MPVISNIKWERFASALAQGKTQVEAYKFAGFNAKYPSQAACALAAKPEVASRVKELASRIERRATAKAVERVEITKELVLRELLGNLERGKTVKGGSAVVNRACELLGKHLGMFRDDQPHKPLTLEDLSTEDLEKLLALPVKEDTVQ